MASCIIVGGGSGGALSSDVTAAKANVLAGTRTITTDSGNAVVEGTMVNRGTVNYSMPINGSFTIQQGYHSGSGKVSQSIPTKAAATYYATTSDQTISSGRYLSGNQIIKKLTQSGLSSANILRGKTITINNGSANVWSVSGSTSVLTTTVIQVSSGLTRQTFRLRDSSTQNVSSYTMYYADINPGITPVFAFCLSGELFMWREPNAFFNMIANSSATGGAFSMTGSFVNASDAPFTSTTLRAFFSSSGGGFVRIFGY